MAKFKPYTVGEEFTTQIDLNKCISEDHLCKQIEKIVSTLDTSTIEDNYSLIGQNAIHPKLLLCVIFYGYATGKRSGRKLAKACEEQLPFIYLSRNSNPQKTCINDFRKNNFTHFTNLFLQVLTKCEQADIGDATFSIVDGSKKEANSSKRRTKNKEQYEKWHQSLLADIAVLEQERDDELSKKKLASKKSLSQKISNAIEVLTDQDSKKRLNLTDPDGPIMRGKKGNFDTNYNVQVACNEDQIISYTDVVTDGNDKAQLVPALVGIEQNTGKKVETVLADADYGTFDSFEYMDNNGIQGYVPYRDMNSTFEDQPFHSSHFIYDIDQDVYTCPQSQTLSFLRIREDNRVNKKYKDYRSDACKTCPFKSQCCRKGVARRVISREVRQGLRDEMKQRLNSEQGAMIYQRRLHPIEAIFGHFKYNLGYTRFLLRGIEKVKAEFTLICLAHNLRKLAMSSINPLIQSFRAFRQPFIAYYSSWGASALSAYRLKAHRTNHNNLIIKYL